MARVFFSYAHEDKDKVLQLKSALEDRHHEVWLDDKDIPIGISIPHAIQIGINNCDFFAVFLTKNAESSPWVKRELATYLMRDVTDKSEAILPLRFDDCTISDFGPLLSSLKYADFTGRFDHGVTQVLERLSGRETTPAGQLTKADYDRLLFSIDLALGAGTTTMMYFNSSFKENSALDERKNLATEADRTAQTRAVARITGHREYENDHIISEEEPYNHGTVDAHGFTWVIDPLDGTTNFVNRIPLFCSAVGVLRNGEPFIGVVYDPVSNEVYYSIGEQKTNVWHVSTGETSFVSVDQNTTTPRQAMAGTHISSREQIANALFGDELFLRISRSFRHVRVLGSGQLALTYVASGRLQAFFQLDTYLWDILAGAVLVRNAGGLVKSYSKTFPEWQHRSRKLVACSHPSILDAFRDNVPDLRKVPQPSSVRRVRRR